MNTREDLFFAKENGYTIYQLNSNHLGVYYLSIPNNQVDNYELFIGFPTKDLKYLPKKEVIEQIKKNNDVIHAINKDGIYALPDIDTLELEEAARENDDKAYKEILQKVQSMTYDINKRLITDSVHDKSIKQVITIIKQTESDTKFINWLEMNMHNFIHGVTLNELRKYYYDNLTKEEEHQEVLEKEEVLIDPTAQKIPESLEETIIIPPLTNTETKTNDMNLEKTNTKILKRVPPKNHPQGFSSVPAIILTLLVSTILGISISYFLIK